MRSARKLKNTTESPSAIGPTGLPAASVITVGMMNSSVTLFAYDASITLIADVAVGPAPRTIASYPNLTRSHRLSRSIA